MPGELQEPQDIADAIGNMAKSVDDGDRFNVNVAAAEQKRQREKIVRSGVGVDDDGRGAAVRTGTG